MAPIVCFVGWSGSGKTSLLEKILPLLNAKGLRINVVKHSHHAPVLEPPTKDSARMRSAGAAEVLLASAHRYSITRELRDEPEPSLNDLVARLSPADLTLVEGYKWSFFPKLEVFRPSLGRPAQYPDDINVVAVVSDVEPTQILQRPVTWLDLNQPEQVVEWLVNFASIRNPNLASH